MQKNVSCFQMCITYLIKRHVQTPKRHSDMCSVSKGVLASGTGHLLLLCLLMNTADLKMF